MNAKEESQLRDDLKQFNNVGEMFHYLSNYFDLFSKPIPIIYKAIVIHGIVSAIKWINPIKK